ncbi:unnamed protein product, partial [marine sediment metagenome]
INPAGAVMAVSVVRSTTQFLFPEFQKNFCDKSSLLAGYRGSGDVSLVLEDYWRAALDPGKE